MMTNYLLILIVALILPAVCAGDNPDFKTVEGGALFLKRGLPGIEGSGVETHRAEFGIAADCEHVASIMNEAEPAVYWYCSTSVPDIVMKCEISGFELDSEAESETGFQTPESLEFSLVLNRGDARGSSELGVPLGFNYTESNSGYLLTSNYPYASGNYFTRAVYLLIIDANTGAVQIRDIGGGANGDGQCKHTVPVSKSAVQLIPEPAIVQSKPLIEEEDADGQVQLSLSFTGDCWTEISDARGQRLFFEMGRDGRSVELSGVAPFAVLFGNVDNVDVHVNGDNYPVSSNNPGSRTARLAIVEPTPAESASPTGMWVVQLGSFGNKEIAEQFAADLRKQGFAAFLSQLSTGDGQLHRVRVGPQKDLKSAEAMAERLARAGRKGKVLPHP